jgi:hypothetical protein
MFTHCRYLQSFLRTSFAHSKSSVGPLHKEIIYNIITHADKLNEECLEHACTFCWDMHVTLSLPPSSMVRERERKRDRGRGRERGREREGERERKREREREREKEEEEEREREREKNVEYAY